MASKEHTVTQVIQQIAHELERAGFAQTEEHAWWIIEAITGKKKAHFIAHETALLTPAQKDTVNDWLEALIKEHKPLQYLIGSVPFGPLEILVEPPVLIPRPETEEWCCNLIDQMRSLHNTPLTIFDLCTGSGCIALAFAHAFPKAKVYGTDISYQALTLARKNSIHNKITNVTFIHSNLLDAISHEFSCDLIVANPPYISESEWSALDVSVRRWEDKGALLATDNGLALIERIIKTAPRYITHNEEMKKNNIPQLVIEIGYRQGNSVAGLMQENNYSTISIKKDLAGKDRVVCGRTT